MRRSPINTRRRATMTAGTQSQIVYTFDNANRLSQLQQGTSTTGFQYNNANRRTLLTLANGVTVSYGYDGDSNLSSLTYKNGASTLGNLTYTYDADSRVLQKGGTFARTGLPQTVSSATYDAANQLLRWGDLTLSYDAAGNLLSDGSNAFTWDARGQVSSVNAVSPLYDAFGRRTKNLAGTQMLYDGANSVQEIVGSTVTANRLTGGLDEFFSRADSTGTYYPLSDSLGSTVALTDSTPNVVTAYTYDPYGATNTSGANSNFVGYTGRENDGNGLYYYRARYYEPSLGRFISQDPIGFSGGVNIYLYVRGNPISFMDSFGLDPLSPEIARLVPISDCSNKGARRIVYELKGRKSKWWVTEHQNPKSWAMAQPQVNSPEGQSTGDENNDAGGFDDLIAGWQIGNSVQTFAISPEDPRVNPNTPSYQVVVELASGPDGAPQDYAALGIWHGGTQGYMYINGNFSGWTQCSDSLLP